MFKIDIYFAWLASFVRAQDETMIFFVCKQGYSEIISQNFTREIKKYLSCLKKSSHHIKYGCFPNYISLPTCIKIVNLQVQKNYTRSLSHNTHTKLVWLYDIKKVNPAVNILLEGK